MMRAALLVGVRYNIKHIIFAGDTVAGDQIGLSTHPVSYINGRETTFDDVIDLARGVLKASTILASLAVPLILAPNNTRLPQTFYYIFEEWN
jgi:hypothetical protein